MRIPSGLFPTLRMATPRWPRTRPERGSWSTGTAAFISKANPKRSPNPKILISSAFWCEFRVVCFTVTREGSSDGESKTTHVDGIARWPLRAGGSLRAGGGDFLCDGTWIPRAEVPVEDLFAGGSGFVGWSASARGRSGSRKRGIHTVDAADAGQGAGEKQEHRSDDARRQAISG